MRKHLSRIKGGRLAAACAGRTVTLAISDVVAPRDTTQYYAVFESYRPMWALLTPDASAMASTESAPPGEVAK